MRKREGKRNMNAAAGLLTVLLSLAILLCLTAALLRKGTIPEKLLFLLLPAECLLSGIVGASVCRTMGGERMLGLLLSGTVPTGILLCLGILLCGEKGTGKPLIWNLCALLLPSLASLALGKPKRKKHRR